MREESASDGTVWISEDADPDEPMLLTGRFSGHLERDNRLRETFHDLEADEAVAWGRARSAVVLIRTGDSDYHSAGEHNPDREAYLAWPPPHLRLERRRPIGFKALDNTERDAPVLWDVRLQVDAADQPEAAGFREKIRSHPAALNVQAPAPGYPMASAALLLETATYNQATEIAKEILEKALEALAKPLPTSGARGSAGASRYTPTDPAGRSRAQGSPTKALPVRVASGRLVPSPDTPATDDPRKRCRCAASTTAPLRQARVHRCPGRAPPRRPLRSRGRRRARRLLRGRSRRERGSALSS